jgi:hypothetical protein
MTESNPNTIIENKADRSQKPTRTLPENTRVSILYGALCGLGFASFAWGVDAILLACNHVAFPFIRLVPAGLIVILVGAFFGWIRSKTSSWLVKTLTWILYIVFLVWLVQIMPTRFAESVISIAHPELKGQLYYGDDPMLGIVAILVGFAVVIAVGFCAVFEEHLIDSFQWPGKPFDKIKLVLFCLFIMGMAGLWSDQVVNTEMREPQIILAKTFDLARDNWGKEKDASLSHEWQLSALKQLDEGVLSTPRFLFKSTGLGLVEVLVDLDGRRAICDLIFSKPTRCVWVDAELEDYP